MPKKTTKTVTETEVVVAHVETSAQAPVKSAKSSKKIKTEPAVVASTPAPVPAPVVAPAPVPEPVTDVDAVVDVDTPVALQSCNFIAKLQELSASVAALKVEYRSIEKRWSREIKSAQKASSKRKRKAGNRAPSGFVKPTKISDELASFLGKEKGSEMARTEVTRDINQYIRTNSLQDKDNGRKINPDDKLATLLKLKETDELTYFNLQRYMSPHFAKAVKDVIVA